MEYHTERFVIRDLELNDCNDVYKLLNDDDIIDNLNMNKPQSVNETKDFIEKYLDGKNKFEKYPFAIEDRTTGELIGVFLLKLDIYRESGFEYTVFLGEGYRGIGAFGEIIPHMISFAFNEIKTPCLRAYIMEKNDYSIKSTIKAGFSLERIFKVDGIEGLIHSYIIYA